MDFSPVKASTRVAVKETLISSLTRNCIWDDTEVGESELGHYVA